MENKYFLRIDNDNFGFVLEGLHETKETDIKIANDDYNKFFELQSNGKQFRLKKVVTGEGLFDYIEECIPEVIIDNTPTSEERLKALEMIMLEVL